MVRVEHVLRGIDNVGVVFGKCIHVYGSGYKKTPGRLGGLFLFSARKVVAVKKLKKKTYTGLLLKTPLNHRRRNGHLVRFPLHGFATFHAADVYKGTTVRGPLPREFRFSRFTDITQLTIKQI